MKKIPKKLLDSLIYLDRLYWETGEFDLLAATNTVCFEIEEECGLDWSSIRNFVCSIYQTKGLCPNAEKDIIYTALKLFGWEVSNEDEESESLRHI